MTLSAISDLHVEHAENRAFVDGLRPGDPADWLIVAGDVANRFDEVISTLARLRERFARVIWTPGNHELWTLPGDPVTARGEERYRLLVAALQDAGVTTPEDPYPVWSGPGGPLTVTPLFLLYDYSFRSSGIPVNGTVAEAKAAARRVGVVGTDELYLHPDPYPGRADWCAARVETTRLRLDALLAQPQARTVLVNHFPLVRQPTARLRRPEFALWCGTERSVDWHLRYRAAAVVYGHLHIPVPLVVDGVPHLEVSLGYPRERRRLPRLVEVAPGQ